MKLLTKLTLFITLSKLAIVVLFVLALPSLIGRIASNYTNYSLKRQERKVLEVVAANGIDYYLQGDSSYGSYTLLKEEYIALEPVRHDVTIDTIETAQRMVESDTLTYRVLMHTFSIDNQRYLLEIGKTVSAISQYNHPLQRVALVVLLSLIGITMLIDLVFTRYLLRPLGGIIKSKLINRRFPFKDPIVPIATSTYDFKYLDASLIKLMEQINEDFEREREFTSNASHELMTPISILQNKIENMLIDPDTPGEMQERLAGLMKTITRLKKIVHSLLLISRIDNEQFSKTDTIAPKKLVEEIIEELGHRLEEKNIELSVSLSAAIKVPALNHDLIFQLFYNIINNAIRYNKPAGKIYITDIVKPGEPYTIVVKDTGIGIAAEDQTAIFNRFKKSSHSESGGYGLGLAIVKSIAHYHQIKLGVESVLGEGTRFTVEFPQGS